MKCLRLTLDVWLFMIVVAWRLRRDNAPLSQQWCKSAATLIGAEGHLQVHLHTCYNTTADLWCKFSSSPGWIRTCTRCLFVTVCTSHNQRTGTWFLILVRVENVHVNVGGSAVFRPSTPRLWSTVPKWFRGTHEPVLNINRVILSSSFTAKSCPPHGRDCDAFWRQMRQMSFFSLPPPLKGATELKLGALSWETTVPALYVQDNPINPWGDIDWRCVCEQLVWVDGVILCVCVFVCAQRWTGHLSEEHPCLLWP